MPVRQIVERHPYGVELDGPHRLNKPHPLRPLALLGLILAALILAAHYWRPTWPLS